MSFRLHGLLGGSFDPIHQGHLQLAQTALETLSLTALDFLPCPQNTHKTHAPASFEARVHMVQLAIQPMMHCRVNPFESTLPAPHHTLQTLKALPKPTDDTAWVWLMGDDAFQDFHTWPGFEVILTLAHIVVVSRAPHQPMAPALEVLTPHVTEEPTALQTRSHGLLYRMNMPLHPASSTEIRTTHDPKHLPPAVFAYIREKKLYCPR